MYKKYPLPILPTGHLVFKAKIEAVSPPHFSFMNFFSLTYFYSNHFSGHKFALKKKSSSTLLLFLSRALASE